MAAMDYKIKNGKYKSSRGEVVYYMSRQIEGTVFRVNVAASEVDLKEARGAVAHQLRKARRALREYIKAHA